VTPSIARKRILLVIGTRPEAIKMAPVAHALRSSAWADVRVLATAQHREMLDQILGFFDLVPDLDLDLMRPNQSLADLTARMIAALDPMLAEVQPDCVLAQGDTTTVMVAALCSFYRRMRFGHVEAGLRTGDKWLPFPEEVNRSMVGRLADVHFAPTTAARDNLLREGVRAETVHVVGNTVIDALLWTAQRVDAAKFSPTHGRRLVLVTAHRRENFGRPFESVCKALRELAERPDVELLYPVHPNPNVHGVAHRLLGGHPRIRLVEPLDYPDMVAAMLASTLIVSDSGGVQEEAPSLGKPVLVLRRETERPEGVAAGAAKLVGPDRERIVAEASRLLDDEAEYRRMSTVRNPYGDGRSALAIAEALSGFLAVSRDQGVTT
jgi:UDP-N-acetylglucosamine 2-epimerase (non-hydrolysing)